MAGSRKEFELLFQLKASLGPNFNSTFKKAVETQKQLQESVKNVNSLQSKVDGYTKTSTAIDQQREKLARLQTAHEELVQKIQKHQSNADQLRKKIDETGDASGELTAQLIKEENEVDKTTEKLKKNESQIRQTTARISDQEAKLDSLGAELRQAGVDTDNLGESNNRLKKSYDQLKNSQEQLARLNTEQAKIKESISGTKSQLTGTVATIAAMGAAIYAGPVKAAMSFESNMAEVAKVVDWLKDDTGAITKEYTELKNEILDLSTKIPMTAQEISQIMAAAGQSNVAATNAELVKFTEDAAKMGIAFDISAEQAGEWMAKWRTSFKMSQEEVITLADQINYLGNTSAAGASEISAIVTKIGPLGEVAGLCSGEIAALGASLVAVGVNEDVAATGIKKVMTTMTAGSAVTERQKAVLDSLGLSATELAQRMQTDAQGAILDFLKAVQRLPEAEQAAALKNYFGEEAVAAIAPLLTNLPYLEEQFRKVGDASLYAGSMQGEYAARADTTENKVQLAKNAIQNLVITLGDVFLPVVGEAAEKLTEIITKIADFARENPELVKTITKVVGSLMLLRTAGLVGKLGFLEIQSGVKTVQKILALFKGNTAAAAATSVGLGTKLRSVGSGILAYFKNVGGAMKGVVTAVGNALSGNVIVSKISGFVSSIAGTLSAGFSGLAGKLAGVVTGAGSKLVTLFLNPFTNIGGKLAGELSGLGGIIARSPLGTIGTFIASGFSKIGTLFAPIGKLLTTALGPLGKLGTTLLGPLGGIAGKFLPVVGVITAVITAVQLLRQNFDQVRNAIGNIFGETGLAIFDKIVQVVTNVGETIKNVFSDGNLGAARDKINEIFGERGVAVFDTFAGVFQKVVSAAGEFVNFVTANIVPVVEQVLNLLVTTIIPGIISGIQAAAPVIMQIFQSIADFIGGIIPIIGSFIAGIMPIISQVITFLQTYVLPVISQIFNFIVSTVLPFIAQGIQQVGSIITTVLQAVLPIVQTVFQTIWSIIQPILQQILSTVQAVLPNVLQIFRTVFTTIGSLVQSITQIFSGLIQFIQGVFTGNWSAAWNGIKNVFQGAWDGLVSIAKGVINGVIGVVNSAISALNSIRIPDWVPVVGGKGINIPTLPTFAKGTKNTPDTFIAGEKGPELITNAPGRVVYTAQQTKDIFRAQNAAAKAAEAATAANVTNITTNNTNQNGPGVLNTYNSTMKPPIVEQPPEVVRTAGQGGGTTEININNSPTVIVNGDQPDDLEEKLEANNRKLLQEVEDLLDKKEDDERRSRYE